MKTTTYMKNREQILDKLLQIPFLKSFERGDLGNLLSQSKVCEYKPDELIIPEGSYDKWIYVLLSGKVKVMKKNKEIAKLEQTGDIFGELAVINDNPRAASVYATEQTLCLAINAGFIKDLNNEDRNAIYAVIYRLFAEILAERLRDTDEHLAKVYDELIYLRRMKDQLPPASLKDLRIAPSFPKGTSKKKSSS